MEQRAIAAICDICGARFINAYQLGPHKVACRNVRSGSFLPDDASEFSNSYSGSAEPTLSDLAQRSTRGERIVMRVTPNVEFHPNKRLRFDYHEMQRTWAAYIANVGNLCSPQFWSMYKQVQQQTGSFLTY